MRNINILCALSHCGTSISPDTMLSGIEGIPASGGSGRGMADKAGQNGAPAIEWPTVVLIIACYAAWAAAGLVRLADLSDRSRWSCSASCSRCSRRSCTRRCTAIRPARRWVNELLVCLPIGLVCPFRRFKALHLRHHADERLTDPFDDPESYYQALWQHDELPAALKAVLQRQQHHDRALRPRPAGWHASASSSTEREADRRRRPRGAQRLGAACRRAAPSCCRSSPSSSASRSGSTCWSRSGSASR